MLMQDYSTELLNLEDVIITNVENVSDELHIYIELPRRDHICPCCGAVTDRIHDYRMQVIKDVPLARNTLLHLRKRRYRCIHCGKRFFEENTFLPRYHRVTNRLVALVMDSFRKISSATEIASTFNISTTTAVRYFDIIEYQCSRLPEVLSIDEFKGNSGGEKYQTIITDPKNKKVLDILPNRYKSDLIQYFSCFDSREDVKYFVTDINPHFREVSKTCFPDAIIVADKYHVIRQAVWAMERVRKTEQDKLSARYRKYFKRSKSLLNKSIRKLTDDEMDRLALMFEISPRLADAYRVKNEFMEIMRIKSSDTGREKLAQWIYTVEKMELPEFTACTKACHNWFQEILNSMDVPWTNGYTEGCNNKTKLLKRSCFGVQNFSRFRNRILHCNA